MSGDDLLILPTTSADDPHSDRFDNELRFKPCRVVRASEHAASFIWVTFFVSSLLCLYYIISVLGVNPHQYF